MVPAWRALISVASAVLSGLPSNAISDALRTAHAAAAKQETGPMPNLALGDDLMFHQNDARRRMEQTLW
jgi:hypothetical protein